MIGPGTGVRVYLAGGVTDMRKGISGLAVLAQDVLRPEPDERRSVCLPRPTWRSVEDPVLGWAGLLPLLQGSGTRSFPLAVSR